MERRDLLIAATLLLALRRDGCVVTAVGDDLRVTGDYSDMQRAMIVVRKAELLAILAVEGAIVGEMDIAIAAPLISSAVASPVPKPAITKIARPSPKPPPSPPLPRGPAAAGVAIMTAEMLR